MIYFSNRRTKYIYLCRPIIPSMGKDDPFILSVFGFFFGLYSFYKGFRALKEKRLIENTPTSKIRSIAMGLVEVAGAALPSKGKLFKSPFSGNDCVYCRHTVEEFRRQGKSSKWVEIESGTDQTPFFVKDETGNVLVDPKGAEIDIPMDFEENSDAGKDPPEKIKNFLAAKGIDFKGLLGNKPMRYREYFIAPSDNLYVMGTAGDNPFVAEGSAIEGAKDIMIQKGKDEIYYISDKQEKTILKEHGTATLGIFGGGALSLACLAYILYRLKMF